MSREQAAGPKGDGIWHFFVPAIWRWYSTIDPRATELVLAVRAINVFFSLSLVLFGSMNLLLLRGDSPIATPSSSSSGRRASSGS